jgi:hypothetical protein
MATDSDRDVTMQERALNSDDEGAAPRDETGLASDDSGPETGSSAGEGSETRNSDSAQEAPTTGSANSNAPVSETDGGQGTASSTESSSTTLGFTAGDAFHLSEEKDWANQEGTGSAASSLAGNLSIAGATGLHNERTETESADGSASRSDVTTFSGELGTDALLQGDGRYAASNEDGSDSGAASALGQFDTGIGVTIQSTSSSSEDADGGSAYASDLRLDVDADVLGVLRSDRQSTEQDSDGSSSGASQQNSLTSMFDSDAMAHDAQHGESEQDTEDDAIVSIDIGGGPLLGVDPGGDSLLSVDTGFDSFEDSYGG